MKRFTVVVSILLVLCFGGVVAYVISMPDFTDPSATQTSSEQGAPEDTSEGKAESSGETEGSGEANASGEGEAAAGDDQNSAAWDKTMDDLLAYLEQKGLISGDQTKLASSGLCSDAVSMNGAEFYWWDLNNLDKDSDEYVAYESLENDGTINLFNSGSIIAPAHNGPFALLATNYTGDVDALTDAFMAFGQDGTD